MKAPPYGSCKSSPSRMTLGLDASICRSAPFRAARTLPPSPGSVAVRVGWAALKMCRGAVSKRRLGAGLGQAAYLGNVPPRFFLNGGSLGFGERFTEPCERVATADRVHFLRVTQVVAFAVRPEPARVNDQVSRLPGRPHRFNDALDLGEKSRIGVVALPGPDPEGRAARLNRAADGLPRRGGLGDLLFSTTNRTGSWRIAARFRLS